MYLWKCCLWQSCSGDNFRKINYPLTLMLIPFTDKYVKFKVFVCKKCTTEPGILMGSPDMDSWNNGDMLQAGKLLISQCPQLLYISNVTT